MMKYNLGWTTGNAVTLLAGRTIRLIPCFHHLSFFLSYDLPAVIGIICMYAVRITYN
jgi:hypothetical protein